jgi:hypothetical protein
MEITFHSGLSDKAEALLKRRAEEGAPPIEQTWWEATQAKVYLSLL